MTEMTKEAMYWEPLADEWVQCRLCPRHCHIAAGDIGFCRQRQNIGGKLHSLNYSRVSSVNLDPIEKKPLFHFHPGRAVLSLGTLGCNLACRFCQNWNISQEDTPTQSLSPTQAVRMALEYPQNLGLAYTYNEPFIWYEYVYETARLARDAGLSNILVTNGYVEEEPLRNMLPYIDAMNVDIKSMRDEFYRELTRGRADPARRTVEIAHTQCLVEITNLVIPNWNDSDADFRELVSWVAGLDPTIPLHFSRYHPAYQMDEPATPVETLYRARKIASEQLAYVYLGNIMAEGIEDTFCPSCGHRVIQRRGFSVTSVYVQEGKCTYCGNPINVISI